MRTALVFPGQGSVREGMAAAWAGHPAAEAFRLAGEHAGVDLATLADDPSIGSSTALAQPALYAAGLASFRALRDAGVRPSVVAGHSLGEITAAVAAGALTADTGAAVVALRGRTMAAACRANPGTMVAVVRVEGDALEELVATVPDAQIANDNAPGQVVVSGPPEAVAEVAERVRELGGRAIALDVEGAFHSSAMASALPTLDALLRRVDLNEPSTPFVSGVDGELVRGADEVRRSLVDGILAPVRWTRVQQRLTSMGVDLVVECGPGGVLKGLAKRAMPDVEVLTVWRPEDVDAVVARLVDAGEPIHLPDDHQLTTTGARP